MAEIFIAIPHHVVASHPHAAIDLRSFPEARFVGVEFRIEQQTHIECKLVGTGGSGVQLHQVTLAAQEWLDNHWPTLPRVAGPRPPINRRRQSS